MKLKIISSKPELLERSKKLGFASTTWQEGDFLQGSFHRKCFDTAIRIWCVSKVLSLTEEKGVEVGGEVQEAVSSIVQGITEYAHGRRLT